MNVEFPAASSLTKISSKENILFADFEFVILAAFSNKIEFYHFVKMVQLVFETWNNFRKSIILISHAY